ncbi:MAG: phytanoyl-CoA dioxygenase family protein [SAR324 cluster bacterium]|nr:phytanoyl-CoA dioxygenase family protein [SAR324 cluster bacterium]
MQRHFFNVDEINLSEFASVCSQTVSSEDYNFASDIQQRVVIYEGEHIQALISTQQAFDLKSELHHCIKEGPGVVVVRQAFQDIKVIDRATELFQEIIDEEKTSDQHRGDHFAKVGENERIWNALQKFCERDTEAFIDYYNNPVLCFVNEAWLGPFFQMTSQVNIVKPGGQAQKPHRDYHLGFQENSLVSEYPLSAQILSQFLTLQEAVAHTDMDISSGSTMMLPFSHQYPLGYMAWRDSKFIEYFQKHAVQLALKKGDAVFFSPALFHAAGTNSKSSDRIANLLQASSAFGKTMESVDRTKMTKLIYQVLLDRKKYHQISPTETKAVWASVIDGYAFPTNLDLDSPMEGPITKTIWAFMERALRKEWPVDRFNEYLNDSAIRRIP